jgi:hypothetical protein
MKREALRSIAGIALGVLLWTLPAADVTAQQIFEAHAKSGQTTMIGAYWPRDGQNETSNGVGSGAFVDHGTVVFKIVRVKLTNMPATGLFYTPNPGFKGVDKVDIPIGPRHLIYNVTVQ